MPPSADVNNISLFISPPKVTGHGDREGRLTCVHQQQADRVCVCLCEGVCEGGRRPLTGESKEKAHSLLKTRSPVLGTLMVGM